MRFIATLTISIFCACNIYCQSDYVSNFKSRTQYNRQSILSIKEIDGDFYISLFLCDKKSDSIYKISIPIQDYFWLNYYNNTVQDIHLAIDSILADVQKDTLYTTSLKNYSKYIVDASYLQKLDSLPIKEIVKKYLVKEIFINTKDAKLKKALIYYFNRKLILVGIADISGAATVMFNYAADNKY
ncbi:MAG: hypothetical protein U0U67_08700 [Chitinophagales bacterium]